MAGLEARLIGEAMQRTRDRTMISYKELVTQFLYQEMPLVISKGDRVDALANAIIGTKQRRWGPRPSPEIEVGVRDYLRQAGDRVVFHLPWGSSKQVTGEHIDIAEFMALKQLHCLQKELERYGVFSEFHFRLEDITDWRLFQDEVGAAGAASQRHIMVERYANDLQKLAVSVLGEKSAFPRLESNLISWADFLPEAQSNTRLIYRYLVGNDTKALEDSGWQGGMSGTKRQHYYDLYDKFYPGKDRDLILARYMAAALARYKLGFTGVPNEPHLSITFAHPIPGDPVPRTRLHYRTMPERFTNNHRPPWLTRGYLKINEWNKVTPKLAEDAKVHEGLIANYEMVGDVLIEAFYSLS